MACEWRHAEMPFADFPNVARWLEGLMQFPGWADPWPATANAGLHRANPAVSEA
jgi:glutathione S-transferase